MLLQRSSESLGKFLPGSCCRQFNQPEAGLCQLAEGDNAFGVIPHDQQPAVREVSCIKQVHDTKSHLGTAVGGVRGGRGLCERQG